MTLKLIGVKIRYSFFLLIATVLANVLLTTTVTTQTKSANMSYVKSFAWQLGVNDIRVNGIAPGTIYTPLRVSGRATHKELVKFRGDKPIGRYG